MLELLVVMGIMAVLIAIGLPVFLGAQQRAEDRGAHADLRNGLATALTYFAEAGRWDGFDAATANSLEPTINWADSGAPAADQVSIHVHADQDLLMVRLSSSGVYFCLAQVDDSPSTSRGRGSVFADVDTVAECVGGW